MKILYIPFYEPNDLIFAAIKWKKAAGDHNILILQHGQEIDYKALNNQKITLYVLAHELSSTTTPFHLTSNSLVTNRSTKLDIEKIAERFNSDFAYVHHQVRCVKLYFCNNKGNEKLIAERFNNNLTLFSAPVHYYVGSITSPWNDKKKYSLFQGAWHKTNRVRNTLFNQVIFFDSKVNRSVKERSQVEFLEQAIQKRRDAVFTRQCLARQERFRKNRSDYSEKLGLHPS